MFKHENTLRYIFGAICWAMAAVITAGLYLELAGPDQTRQVLMLILAIGLEGAKITAWRSPQLPARILSVFLIAISLFAGLAAAVDIVEQEKARNQLAQSGIVCDSDQYRTIAEELTAIDRERAVMLDRIESLPRDYTTAARTLLNDMEKLRSTRMATVERLASIKAPTESSPQGIAVFRMISDLTGAKPETIELIILFLVACCIEGSGLVLAGRAPVQTRHNSGPILPQQVPATSNNEAHVDTKAQPSTTLGPGPTAEDYFVAARKLGTSGRLAGYRQVMEALECSEPTARRLRAELVQAGRIKSENRKTTEV